MSRVWFAQALETAAIFWRVLRRDGIALGFITHDHDLWFDGVLHRSTPGMVPSSIRRSAGFEADSAEVEGTLTHDSIAAADLSGGRFDGARVLIGLVDWETLERHILYRGEIGSVLEEAGKFSAELQSRKLELQRDPIPRTSPFCRALFCGPGCTLSAVPFTHEAKVTAVDTVENSIMLDTEVDPAALVGGTLRWLDGPHAGSTMEVVAATGTHLVVDTPLQSGIVAGQRLIVREGCDHTLETCSSRFANAINFQGEPFLPGNDQIYRYPPPSSSAAT
jgi:uncharacterized phage protein (TIGR02218 family)